MYVTPVDHLTQVDPPLSAPRLAGRNERRDDRPFLVAGAPWQNAALPVVDIQK